MGRSGKKGGEWVSYMVEGPVMLKVGVERGECSHTRTPQITLSTAGPIDGRKRYQEGGQWEEGAEV